MANNKEQIGFIKAASEVVQHEAKKVSATSIELAKYEAVSTRETEDRKGWVNYGLDNNYPQYLIDLYYSSPYHNTLCNGISEMIAGEGVFSSDLTTETKLKRWKINKKMGRLTADFKIQGGYYFEVILTTDKKDVAEVNVLPFENCRVSYSESFEEVNGVWYSKDWTQRNKEKYKPKFIPLFKGLPQDEQSKEFRYVLPVFRETVGSDYYPKPDYQGVLHYIELSRQIGVYHVNNIMNGLFPSFIIQMNNGQPDPEKATEVRRDIERNISGASNAGKFIVLFNDTKETAAQFDPFPISDADKQYEFLSRESRDTIMVGHRVTTPLLFGIRDSGGGLGSNTDEMKQGLEIFEKKVIRPYRLDIINALEYILEKCGSYGKVEFIENAQNTVIEAAPTTTTLSKEHVCCKADNTLSEEDEAGLIARLETLAETIDGEEWEEIDIDIDTEACSTSDEEAELLDKIRKRYKNEMEGYAELSLASYANGDERSEWGDVGLFKLRYAYSKNISADSREFCKAMVRLSNEGKVFRFEDIAAMSDAGENGQFAPQGENTYDIFTWKGGVYCHHKWLRKIYFRKREKGRFLPNDGLKNDILVGNNPFVKPKGPEGIAPINTATRGSLKNP